MKIQIESTEMAATVDGVPCRVWRGQTARGNPVVLLVTTVTAVSDSPGEAELAEELIERSAPLETLPLADALNRLLGS